MGLSPGIVDGFARRGVARERITLIPNGCDLDIFAAPATHWRPAGVGAAKLMVVLTGTHGIANGLDNVVSHPPVGKDKLAGLMVATDVGLQILANVLAIYYGSSPNKFLDYLASGLPVHNNYPGWLAKINSHHQCGYAVPMRSSP